MTRVGFRRFTAGGTVLLLVGVVGLCGAWWPAAAKTSARPNRIYCDHFGDYAQGTSCARAWRVERRYAALCVPKRWPVTSRLPACHRVILGFRCNPTGDAYHYVYCRRHRRLARVRFHLAE